MRKLDRIAMPVGAAADKVWTAKDSSGEGEWRTPAAGGVSTWYTDAGPTTDFRSTSPSEIVFRSGTFTPSASQHLAFLDTNLSHAEGLLSGHTGIELLYSQTVAFPLARREAVMGAALYRPGVSHKFLGSVSGNPDPFSRAILFTGLTPGVAVRWEITVSVVAYAYRIALPETPTRCRVAQNFVTADTRYGGALVGLTGATKFMLCEVNHQANLVDRYLGSLPLPGATHDICFTKEGTNRLAVVSNYEDNSLYVIDTYTLEWTRVATPTNSPWGLTAAPDGTVWVAFPLSQGVRSFNATTRTFGSLITGSVTNPFGLDVNPAGTKLYAACGDRFAIYNLTGGGAAGTFEANVTGLTNMYDVAVSPDGTRIYGIGGAYIGCLAYNGTAHGILYGGVLPQSPISHAGIAFFDNHTFGLFNGSSDVAASAFHQHHVDDLSEFQRWPSGAVDGGPNVPPGSGYFGSGGITKNGSIVIPTTNALNIWFGGAIEFRGAGAAGFYGEVFDLKIMGAS